MANHAEDIRIRISPVSLYKLNYIHEVLGSLKFKIFITFGIFVCFIGSNEDIGRRYEEDLPYAGEPIGYNGR